jgi:hypothetical protein
MTATEHCFPYSGFYVYEDSSEAEEHLINYCKNVTVADYNDVKDNSNLFTVMHVNCRSIVNKVTELESLLFSLNNKPDICFFSETWLSNNALAPHFANYSGHHMVREGRGGGVSIYVQNCFDCHEMPCCTTKSTFECVGTVVKVNESLSVLSICIYRPPNTDINVFFDELEELFVSVTNAYPRIDRLIVGGDFNINLLDSAKHVELFMDLLTSHSLFPTIFQPTRPGSNALLDNIFLSWPNLADSFVLMYDVSDHLPIITRLHTESVLKLPHDNTKMLRVHSEANVSSFRAKLSSCDWSRVFNAPDVNTAYNAFHTIVNAAYTSAFPLQLCHENAKKKLIKPWMTTGLWFSAKNRSRLYRDYIKGKISKDYYCKYRNLFVSLTRHAKRAYYAAFFQKNRCNIKAVWQHVRSLRADSKVKLSHGTINELNNFYAELGPNTVLSTCANDDYMRFVQHNTHSFVLRETDRDEIICTCHALQSKLSAGFDCISTKLLQCVVDLLAYPLEYIFNLSFKSGVYPDLFKIGGTNL